MSWWKYNRSIWYVTGVELRIGAYSCICGWGYDKCDMLEQLRICFPHHGASMELCKWTFSLSLALWQLSEYHWVWLYRNLMNRGPLFTLCFWMDCPDNCFSMFPFIICFTGWNKFHRKTSWRLLVLRKLWNVNISRSL